MGSGVRYLPDVSVGKMIEYNDPTRLSYHEDEGVLVENNEPFAGRNDRISRLIVETDTAGPPEFKTRGPGCPPDNVDCSVRVRYTQPRKASA